MPKNNSKIKKLRYSIVVPVYNSEKSLNELCSRINATFKSITSNYEIVLVNDNSKDKSWRVMQEINRKDGRIRIIDLMKNFGQHNALMCGFNYARGEYIITMDDDLQHPPEEIPKLIKKINEGYDVVYGEYLKKKHYWIRNMGSRCVNYALKKVTGINCTITSFRIIHRRVVDKITMFKNYNSLVDVYISNVTSNESISSCIVNHNERKYGKTNYTFRGIVKFATNMMLNFTVLPLRIATFIGIFFALASGSMGIYYLIQYFTKHITVGGFTSLILSITFFSGVILFVLGIIGEYIGRIFMKVNDKPQFIVRELRV